MPQYPTYLNLTKKNWEQRIQKTYQILEKCQVCPRKCGVNRLKNERGFCRLGNQPMISSFQPHFWEESCLVGQHGSGTIFFTHCNLFCVFCQNYGISQLGYGEEVSLERLAEMMIALQGLGCHNINLVTPTSQIPQILAALPLAIEKGLKLPLVYNTNAYDSVETLKLLDGIIDIYMPDAKYADDKIALKYSAAPKYFEIMKVAIKEMHRQVGDLKLKIKNKKLKITEKSIDGLAYRGLLVRHLVLPNNLAGTEKIMEFLAKEVSTNTFINIMYQYQPRWKANQYPEINRGVTLKEYEEALAVVRKFGLKRFAE